MRKGGGLSGLIVSINHQITSWESLFMLPKISSKCGMKQVEENSVTGPLQELLQEVLYCYRRPCFATGGVLRAF